MNRFGSTGDGNPLTRFTAGDGIGAAAAARWAIGRQQDAPKPTRLHGTVQAGVEHGSRVLLDDHGVVLAQLMGGPPAVLEEGCTVTVTGVFRRDLLTTVQQGAPFQVQDAVAD